MLARLPKYNTDIGAYRKLFHSVDNGGRKKRPRDRQDTAVVLHIRTCWTARPSSLLETVGKAGKWTMTVMITFLVGVWDFGRTTGAGSRRRPVRRPLFLHILRYVQWRLSLS